MSFVSGHRLCICDDSDETEYVNNLQYEEEDEQDTCMFCGELICDCECSDELRSDGTVEEKKK